MKLLLMLAFSLMLPVQAQELRVAWGRIALIDLGSLLKSEPLIGDINLLRVYSLSAMEDEESKSIIALQGLSDSGATDLSIDSHSGLIQTHVALSDIKTEDLVLDPSHSRTCIITTPYSVQLERSIVVETDAPFNELVLASQPTLIELRHLHKDNDVKYFKTLVLHAKAAGLTDIVIATKSRVYKFTLKIGGTQNEHTERIKLDTNSCQR